MTHPERLVVGHPFNPVYLLPLVEVCGGEASRGDDVGARRGVYRAVGMRPLGARRKEIDGFVADRLLEALWREALWLVQRRRRHGRPRSTTRSASAPGLRWSFMGTFLDLPHRRRRGRACATSWRSSVRR